jgi:hypothetical protein
MQPSTSDILTGGAEQRGMRGWLQIGVVLSVFWFVWFDWWLRKYAFDTAWDVVTPKRAVAVVDALSLAVLWLVVWITVMVGRWVASGFRRATHEEAQGSGR